MTQSRAKAEKGKTVFAWSVDAHLLDDVKKRAKALGKKIARYLTDLAGRDLQESGVGGIDIEKLGAVIAKRITAHLDPALARGDQGKDDITMVIDQRRANRQLVPAQTAKFLLKPRTAKLLLKPNIFDALRTFWSYDLARSGEPLLWGKRLDQRLEAIIEGLQNLEPAEMNAFLETPDGSRLARFVDVAETIAPEVARRVVETKTHQ